MRLLTKQRYPFSISSMFYETIALHNKNHKPTQIASSSIHVQPNIQSTVYTPVAPTYQVTKLPSGVSVLTESVTVPSNVHIGIHIDVGTRDEDHETSGAVLLLKHAHLKTGINTNETVNYGIVQMAGG